MLFRSHYEGQPEPWGLFALRGSELDLASELSGYDVEDIKMDPEANVHAAAALLAHYAEEAGIDRALRPEPTQWGPAIELMGEIDEDRVYYNSLGGAIPKPAPDADVEEDSMGEVSPG